MMMPLPSNTDQVKDYVTAADHLQFSWLADGMVQVDITHSNLKQYCMELRLDLHSSIAEVKRKLYSHSGTSLSHMTLLLKHSGAGGAIIGPMDDDDKPLGYYGVRNGMEIHVVDNDPTSLSRGGGLDDVSLVQKYRMTDEDYDKREKTLRAYKREQLKKDPGFKFLPENRRKPPPGEGAAGDAAAEAYLEEACVAGIAVGQRCQLNPGGRRGTVRWVGAGVASLAPGYWVGVELDEPVGLGSGARGGVEYFACPDKYGSFARPDRLEVGDFPPEFENDGEGAAEPGGGAASGGGAATAGSAPEEVAAAPAPAPPPAPAAAPPKPRRRGADEDEDSDSEL